MLWLSVANKDVYIIYCLLYTYSALCVTYLPPRGATVHALNRKSVKKITSFPSRCIECHWFRPRRELVTRILDITWRMAKGSVKFFIVSKELHTQRCTKQNIFNIINEQRKQCRSQYTSLMYATGYTNNIRHVTGDAYMCTVWQKCLQPRQHFTTNSISFKFDN